MKKIRYFALILSLAFPLGLLSQVNIEKQRMTLTGDSYKLLGDYSITYLDGNSELLSMNFGPSAVLRRGKFMGFLLSDYTLIKGSQSISDKAFVHFRLQILRDAVFQPEFFSQLEYNKNRLLDSRKLLGGGVRMNFSSAAQAGAALMYENEMSIDGADVKKIRISSYFSLNYSKEKKYAIGLTSYFQPSLDNLMDLRFISEGGLNFTMTRHISFFTKVIYRYDSDPYMDLKAYDIEIKQGLGFTFGN